MGYYIESRDCNFLLKRENVPNAWKALKELFQSGFNAGWVETQIVLDAPSFEDAIDECGFTIEAKDDVTDYDYIYFNGEKYSGDENVILSAIAPYVEPDSYIEMSGEDGEHWRWIFGKDGVIEKHAKLVWDE